MGSIRRFALRVATLFRSNRAERELAREIDAHLRLLEDEFVAKGMSREDARDAAKRAFGGVEQAKEQQRDARSFRWLVGWPMDIKLGARMLLKSPGLTIVAVTALAVAIGAGAAYLEFTRDLLYPKLDVPGAERIVGIKAWDVERRVEEIFTAQKFALLRANTRAMELLGAARPVSRHLTTADGRTEPARAVAISATAFRLVPAMPLHGRTLGDDDERADAEMVAVIGYDLWRTRFDGNPAAVGTLVRIGSTPHTIVGVIPALKATGPQLQGRLREGASGTSTMKFGGLWTSVIVTQTALTVVFLATVVALGWSSYKKHAGTDVIYPRDQLLTARVAFNDAEGDADANRLRQPPSQSYGGSRGSGGREASAYRAIADRLANEPGIASVTYTTALPGTIWDQVAFEFQSPEL